MAELLCEKVSDGMRKSERIVTIRDVPSNRRDFVRVEFDFLTAVNGNYYLPVGVVQEDPVRHLVLVELPQESECGNNRLWVRSADLLPATPACP